MSEGEPYGGLVVVGIGIAGNLLQRENYLRCPTVRDPSALRWPICAGGGGDVAEDVGTAYKRVCIGVVEVVVDVGVELDGASKLPWCQGVDVILGQACRSL